MGISPEDAYRKHLSLNPAVIAKWCRKSAQGKKRKKGVIKKSEGGTEAQKKRKNKNKDKIFDKKKSINYHFPIEILREMCYADNRASGRRKMYMPVSENERPRFDIETIKVDGIEPTPEMKELLEKEKRGEITREEIQKMFDRGYRMKL